MAFVSLQLLWDQSERCATAGLEQSVPSPGFCLQGGPGGLSSPHPLPGAHPSPGPTLLSTRPLWPRSSSCPSPCLPETGLQL